ncbi:MAG: L,D-transpeptidase family protein [Paenibacillaceae bacterium]
MRFSKLTVAFIILFLCTITNIKAAEEHYKKETINETISIQINPLKNELIVLDDHGPFIWYPIAMGKPETPTPVGDFVVVNKFKNWGSGFGTRWIGLNVPWGTYGIHGTNRPQSIGLDASHGCIRMLNSHVEKLYELVKVGAKVSILGHVLGEPNMNPRRLAKGDSGGDVLLIQNRLRSGGFYNGVCSGKFDTLTEHAMKTFEKANNLPVDGVVSIHDYYSLGLVE